MSWSVRADSGGNGDSPGRQSLNEQSNRTVNMSRGDSLAYSEDSQDHQNLLNSKAKTSSSFTAEREARLIEKGKIFKGPNECCHAKQPKQSMNESMNSEDSLQETSKRACCVIQ